MPFMSKILLWIFCLEWTYRKGRWRLALWDMWEICGPLTVSICKNDIRAFPSKFQSYSLQITSSSCFLNKLSNLRGRECKEGWHIQYCSSQQLEPAPGNNRTWQLVDVKGKIIPRDDFCGQFGRTKHRQLSTVEGPCWRVFISSWKTWARRFCWRQMVSNTWRFHHHTVALASGGERPIDPAWKLPYQNKKLLIYLQNYLCLCFVLELRVF